MTFNFPADTIALESVLFRQFLMVSPETPVSDVLTLMRETQKKGSPLENVKSCGSCVLVGEEQRLLGIFTQGDMLHLNIPEKTLAEVAIAKIMTQPVITLHQSELTSLWVPLNLLQDHQINHLPILDAGDRILGIVTPNSLLQALNGAAISQQLAVSENTERWYLAVLGSQDGVWDWNLQTHEIFYSSRWKEMLGYTDSEITNQISEWEKLIHPEDLNWVIQANQDYLNQKTPFYQAEYRMQCKDGRYKWIYDRGQAVWDHNGNPIRMVGVHSDITERKQLETQLRKSEAHLSVAQRIAHLGSWEFNLETQEVTWSRETFEIFSRNPEAGSPTLAEFYQYLHPDDYLWVERSLLEVLESKQPFQADYRILHPDGTCRYVQARSELIIGMDGQSVSLAGTVLDITERKQIEQILRQRERELTTALEELQVIEEELRVQNEELYGAQARINIERQRYQDLFNSAPDAYLVTNEQSLILAANHKAETLFATPIYQLLSKRLIDFVAETDVVAFARYIYQLTHGNPVDQLEIQLQLPNQALKPVSLRVTIVQDSQGEKSLRWIIRNITQQKQVEAQLRSLSARLAVAIKSGAIGIWEWDIVSDRLIWDDRMYELYGVQPSEFTGAYEAWIKGVYPGDREPADAIMQKALEGEQEFDTEFRVIHPDGSIHFLKAYGLILRDPQGQPQQMIGINFDITEQKQVQEQLRKANDQLLLTNAELARATRLKDEFLANMSHELRTPLNAILGMTEGLQENVFGEINDRQCRAIQTIERSGRHLLELINDVLDLSKIESGKLELQLAPVEIPALCHASLAFVRQQALKKNIQLTLEVAPNFPDLLADERRLRQILINLLNNAIKFTPDGGQVQLKVQLERQSDQTFVSFSIQDTGIGIAPENLGKLFQSFMQIDSSLSRQHSGTGLGLALVRRLTELHHGTVAVTSAVNQGSCFTVRIPYSESLQAVEVAEPAAIATGVLSPDNSQVLIVEDSIVAAEQMARYLGEVGMNTTIYPRGEGALDEALQTHPALIILDLQLPSLSGWEVLHQLKTNPQTQHIPVVVVSVMDEQSRGIALGATEYLVKPITREQLRRTLEQLRHPQATTSTALIITPPARQTSPLILLAEDNEANITTFSNYLESRGYRLMIAKTGQEAVHLTQTECPDLILMDIQMPEMNGLEAIRLIRNEPQFQKTPIIALTALAMPGDREKCLSAGANDYLAKPLRLKQLVQTIQQLLETQ